MILLSPPGSSAGVTDVCVCPVLALLCAGNLNAGPHSCTPSALNHQPISPDPFSPLIFFFYKRTTRLKKDTQVWWVGKGGDRLGKSWGKEDEHDQNMLIVHI